MKKLVSFIVCFVLILSVCFAVVACDGSTDEYDEQGRMILNLRNLYFNEWTGGDPYLAKLEEKFNVRVNVTSYSWQDWTSQVNNDINGNDMPDVFHYNLDNYNFSNSYKRWAVGESIKPLPDDLSRWPNVKRLVDNTDNIDKLKLDGKLYCIPIAKNINGNEAAYSPFTYVYRRDWAKKLNVYQPDDVYTWQQFSALLEAFKKEYGSSGDIAPLADVEWGFPSITNFYKSAPHCFSYDEASGKFVASYTTDQYMQGVEQAKSWVKNGYYGLEQYAVKQGEVNTRYQAGRVGVFYENLSLANYTTLRKAMAKRSEIQTVEQLDDATAIMKVSGPDGTYALEGTDNWFSASFFSADISDEKMAKILDIMDWLLSEEGTMTATYGFEGYDYEIDADGNVTLTEDGWEKDKNGDYIDKMNGCKYLRYMCTLCYDINAVDPLTDQKTLSILNDWYSFMNGQLANGNLRVLKEDPSVKWLTTPQKASNVGGLLDKANTMITQYTYGKKTLTEYKESFNTSTWQKVLAEINESLGK